MKLGLVTIYQVPNYGSVLQAFATQCVLEKLGHKCMVLKYQYPNSWHYKNGHTKAKFSLKKNIGRFLGLTPYYRRLKVLNSFRKNNLNFTKKFTDYTALEKYDWNDYDGFITGSDQVWNVRFLKGDPTFLLSFLPEGKNRFALSSSFALNSLPERFHELFKRELKKYNAISVREANGAKIIQNQLGITTPISVCLDPTLLIDRDGWLQLVKRSRFKKKRRYILWYMLAYAFEPRPYIDKVAEHFQKSLSDCDIIALEGYTPIVINGMKMKNKEDSSIENFIDLFANADLVITSSFHGTVFAVNFGIPLISIVPENHGDDRQINLLEKLGLQQCIAHLNDNISDINPYYDSSEVQMNLNMLRQESISWIKENIT